MPDQQIPTPLTNGLGQILFAARWLMAPIYVGLIVGLVLLIVKFVQTLAALVPQLLQMSRNDVVLGVLGLADLSLVANLILSGVVSGWQACVEPLLTPDGERGPGWLALDFSAIKLKLIGSIAVIAAIDILESFTHIDTVNPGTVGWQLAILLSIGLLGLLLAAMDRLSHPSSPSSGNGDSRTKE